MLEGVLADLNPDQRAAVTHGKGPLLVLAGAGSGKTRVITVRIAWLLAQGIEPEQVLAVTFTNRAAKEMRERLAGLVGAEAARRVTAGTFHAVCARLLRERGAALGLPASFGICDASDAQAAVRAALRDLKVSEKRMRPSTAQALVSRRKNGARREDDDLLERVHRAYEAHLRRSSLLDFDDLLLYALRLVREHPQELLLLQQRWRHVLVDEYQDVNAPQDALVSLLAQEHRSLCAVGDDDQSIYGWRGADSRHILEFPQRWPDAAVVRLLTNYRSTQPILDLANRVIACNPHRHDKALRSAEGDGPAPTVLPLADEEEEARYVVGEIERLRAQGARAGDVAVLLRTSIQSRPFESALRTAKIPYVLVGGPSFFDRKEVRDVLAWLRLLVRPGDEPSLVRAAQSPPRGLGAASLDKLLQWGHERKLGAHEAFARAGEVPGLPPAAVQGARDVLAILKAVPATGPLPGIVRALVEAVGYKAEVERSYDTPAERLDRWAAVEEVIHAAETFERREEAAPTKLVRFLDRLALAAEEAEDKDKEGGGDAVTLLTLHSAKGLEFPVVFLCGVEEGLLPHQRAIDEDTIEEERRLVYVGLTRAQRRLTVSFATYRNRFGHRQLVMPSRFVFEMTGQAPPAQWQPAKPREDEGPGRRKRRKVR